jgi:2-polyprenyl-3-methyl-5-hydroxy-6-metoxy-1,4-benzoquinol methylase
MIQNLETISCPNCSGVEAQLWAEENCFKAVKCACCGLVYVNPRPEAREIAQANQLGVHQTEAGTLDVKTRRHSHRIRAYKRRLCQMFASEISSGRPMTWLDVGAGYGEFVEAIQAVLPPGSYVEGIEPMRPKVQVATTMGLNLREGTISDVDQEFDGISLINVFSHIPDFMDFGREIGMRIKPGGILFIETGNGGDLARRADYPDRLYLPDHLVFAGADTLSRMVKRLGFEVELVKTERIDGFFHTAKSALLGLIAGKVTVRWPYTSHFRTIFLKARKPA